MNVWKFMKFEGNFKWTPYCHPSWHCKSYLSKLDGDMS